MMMMMMMKGFPKTLKLKTLNLKNPKTPNPETLHPEPKTSQRWLVHLQGKHFEQRCVYMWMEDVTYSDLSFMSGNAAAAAAKYEPEGAKQKSWDQNKNTWCQSGSFVCRLICMHIWSPSGSAFFGNFVFLAKVTNDPQEDLAKFWPQAKYESKNQKSHLLCLLAATWTMYKNLAISP